MNKLNLLKLQITSILGGISELWGQQGEGQFLTSLGIDPEGAFGSLTKSSGGIYPTRFTEFSTSDLSSAPMWITGAPTTTGVFVYEANGTLRSYASTLTSASEQGIATIEGGEGQGLAAYNDYLYASNTTSVVRYGRLSQTAPTLADYWITGLSMSSLTDSEYPSTRDVTYPAHVLHPHVDGRLYIAEFDGANGRIHSLTTDSAGANGSATYNDLVLPPAMLPMDMDAYGTDIAILLSPQGKYASGDIPKTGNSLLALWDTTPGNKAYRFVPINEPLATALINRNGELCIVCGNIDVDSKLMRYLGGYSFESIASIPEGFPPPAGAADTIGNMIAWGGSVTYPTTGAGVYTYGFRSGRLPGTSLNNIARISDATATLPIITCLKFIQRGKNPVIGWRTGTPTFGLDKAGSGTFTSYFRSQVFSPGKNFIVRRLSFPLSTNVQAGVIITPTIYVDNEAATFAAGTSQASGLIVVNNTNYSSNELFIDQQGIAINGQHNFYVEFQFTGTAECGIMLPISIEVELVD